MQEAHAKRQAKVKHTQFASRPSPRAKYYFEPVPGHSGIFVNDIPMSRNLPIPYTAQTYRRRRRTVHLRSCIGDACSCLRQRLGIDKNEFGNYDNGVDSGSEAGDERGPRSHQPGGERCDNHTKLDHDEGSEDRSDDSWYERVPFDAETSQHPLLARDSMELCRSKSKAWTHHTNHALDKEQYESESREVMRPSASRRVTFPAQSLGMIPTNAGNQSGNIIGDPSRAANLAPKRSTRDSIPLSLTRLRMSWLRPTSLPPVALAPPDTQASSQEYAADGYPEQGTRDQEKPLKSRPKTMYQTPDRTAELWQVPSSRSEQELSDMSAVDINSPNPGIPSTHTTSTSNDNPFASAAPPSLDMKSSTFFRRSVDSINRAFSKDPLRRLSKGKEPAAPPPSPDSPVQRIPETPPRVDLDLTMAPKWQAAQDRATAANKVKKSKHESDDTYDTPILRKIGFGEGGRVQCDTGYAKWLAKQEEPWPHFRLWGLRGPRRRSEEEMEVVKQQMAEDGAHNWRPATSSRDEPANTPGDELVQTTPNEPTEREEDSDSQNGGLRGHFIADAML